MPYNEVRRYIVRFAADFSCAILAAGSPTPLPYSSRATPVFWIGNIGQGIF